MEASLDEVMKMNTIMRSLQKVFIKIEHYINSNNNKNDVIKACRNDNSDERKIDKSSRKNMMISSISIDKIFRDDIKLNNISKANGGINSIEDVDEMSNDKGISKDDLEIKIGIIDNKNNVRDDVKTVIKIEEIRTPVYRFLKNIKQNIIIKYKS
ncbi:hypothetical protein C2G38_2041569 [Gigaspora rosea]|uniref:Uncharacterized protein n=1 Tax=Gigaspora rosea TaxID=44941 RepID=A0A397USI3_9GLOM|nr:hypothetical protein C2G38_2041569 [Gigaspora rosea]